MCKKLLVIVSLLVISEILGSFVHTITADDKYSLVIVSIATNWNTIIEEQTKSFWIFICICKIYIKFWIFWKTRWPSFLMYFRKNGLQMASLDKCRKSPVSEHRWTVNILKDPKHCKNLLGSTFIRFCHHSERNGVRKCLSKWYLKFYSSLWTDSGILFVIVRIYCHQCKCNYLRIWKCFQKCLLHF